jgi:hypothetical protein
MREQFLNIVLREHETSLVEKDIDYRRIGRLSIAYMMAIVGEVLRTRPVDFTDVLIVTAIFNANGAEKRGVSRNAVHRMLNIPLETARRRINALIAKKALIEQDDGLVFASGNDLGLGDNAALDKLNIERLRQLFAALKAEGVEFDDLPRP